MVFRLFGFNNELCTNLVVSYQIKKSSIMKKSISPMMALSMVFWICACTQSPEKNMIQTFPENEAIVHQYMDALTKGDHDVVASLLADDFISYGPKLNDSLNRMQTLEKFKQDWETIQSVSYDRYATFSTHVPEGRVAGDWVFDWGLVSFTYNNGMPSWTTWWHGVYMIKDGKIIAERGFFNEADIMQQLGFTFTPPKSLTEAEENN